MNEKGFGQSKASMGNYLNSAWFKFTGLVLSILLNIWLIALLLRVPVVPSSDSKREFTVLGRAEDLIMPSSEAESERSTNTWRPQEGVLTLTSNIVGHRLIFKPNTEPFQISDELIESLSLNKLEMAALLESYSVFLSGIRAEEAAVIESVTDELGKTHIRIPPLAQTLTEHTDVLFADFERILGIERASLMKQLAKWDSTIHSLDGTERLITYMPNGSASFGGHSYQYRVIRDGKDLVNYTSKIHSKEQGVGSSVVARFEGVIDFDELMESAFPSPNE